MAYDGKVMRRAMARYQREKQKRAAEFARRREQLYARVPQLEEIERQLSTTMSQIITGALDRGTDPLPAIRVIRDKNLDLQRQRMDLLRQNGYPEDYLEEKPACFLCGDTGYVNGQVCQCLQRLYREEQNRELSRMLDLGSQSFETFDLDWYDTEVNPAVNCSSYDQMERNKYACYQYARQFGPQSGNLLLTGQPGTGKTHLSSSIARVVSDRGFSVVYDTATHIFAQMEAVRFRREEDAEAQEDVRRYENCDLLILDDLGTEMTTSFVVSALYELINKRLLEGKQTVISTNVRKDQLAERYSPQIRSRLVGEYKVLPFFGRDVREAKNGRS